MTTFTHDDETGWSFTIGTQPYIGFTTKEQAQEAAYDLTHGRATTIADPLITIMRMVDELEDETSAGYVTVERHWSDEKENSEPAPGAEFWTDYTSGCVLLGVDDDHQDLDLIIHCVNIETVPITLATLIQIHADMGRLLADARVQAALGPEGSASEPTHIPTMMVRVPRTKVDCRFDTLLMINIGAAIERNKRALGISQQQVYAIVEHVSSEIEKLFDLTGEHSAPLAKAA